MNDLDLSYNEYAKCPYCGYEDIDSFELNCNDEILVDCPNCDKEYGVVRNIEVTYSTWIPEENKEVEVRDRKDER